MRETVARTFETPENVSETETFKQTKLLTANSVSLIPSNEIKGAEKALKSNNFASAKTFIKSAESMESSMDAKTLAKFYFLKGQTRLSFANYSHYIITGQPFNLSAWGLLILNRFKGKKTFIWNHGWYGNESFLKKTQLE